MGDRCGGVRAGTAYGAEFAIYLLVELLSQQYPGSSPGQLAIDYNRSTCIAWDEIDTWLHIHPDTTRSRLLAAADGADVGVVAVRMSIGHLGWCWS